MTACLFVSPPFVRGQPELGVTPAIICDTMVTAEAPPAGSMAIIPSSVSNSNITVPTSVRLVRKLNIVGDAALAMSGNDKDIRNALYEYNIQHPEWKHDSKPFKELEAWSKKIDIGIIGSKYTENGTCINTELCEKGFNLPNLGFGGAIGSGTKEILEICRRFDKNIDFYRYDSHQIMLASLCSAINADRLNQEIANSAKNNWGGYMEFAYFDFSRRQWVRGPNALNLFFVVRYLSDTDVTVEMISFIVAYDPGGSFGRVLSLRKDESGENISEFLLQDIMDDTKCYFKQGILSDWGDWYPAIVTSTINGFRHGTAQIPYIRSVFPGDFSSEVVVKFDSSGSSVGLSNQYSDFLFSHACGSHGLRYIPYRQLR